MCLGREIRQTVGWIPARGTFSRRTRFVSSPATAIVTAGDDYTIRIWSSADFRRSGQEHKGNERQAEHGRGFGEWMYRLMENTSSPRVVTTRSAYGRPAPAAKFIACLGHTWLGSGHLEVRFTPDGKQFASWGDDMRVYVWDVASGKAVENFIAIRRASSLI